MKNPKKALIALASVALLLCAAVGSTAAYLRDNTGTVTNTFLPGQVSCAVVENGTAYTDSTVSVANKSNVTVKNTGNVPAYIRAAILVTWKSADGTVYAAVPQSGTGKDYTLQLNTADWSESGGFYYYKSAVAPEGLTSALISSARQITAGPVGVDHTQYTLSIEILAEAIQADGMGASSAQDAWNAV